MILHYIGCWMLGFLPVLTLIALCLFIGSRVLGVDLLDCFTEGKDWFFCFVCGAAMCALAALVVLLFGVACFYLGCYLHGVLFA